MKGFTLFVVVAAVSRSGADMLDWGKYASENEGSFVVKITKTEDNEFLCMGAIIYPQWVLTTAHCLENENITISAGSNFLTTYSRQRESSLQKRLVTSKKFHVIHPNYTSQDSGSNNIGLVYIEEPFNLTISQRVSRIFLPTVEYKPKSGKVLSWGERIYLPFLGAKLHITTVSEVHANDYCAALGVQPRKPYLMCSSGHSSPYYLDEGGPLVVTMFKEQTLIGIINRQIPQEPGLATYSNVNATTHYTSVPYFVTWLFEVVSFFVPPDY